MNPTVQEPFCPPRPKLPEANILESSYLIDLTRMTNQQVRSMPLKNMTILAAAPSNTACFCGGTTESTTYIPIALVLSCTISRNFCFKNIAIPTK